jgi:hypothetical protein
MTDLSDEAAKARTLGLALLDVSRVYEGFPISSFEGGLKFPPHRRAIIGLVGRQRRLLRATYTLADAEQVLESIGPLRSMLEFLICQRWLAVDPDVNVTLWMAQDHASRDLMREKMRQHTPALHDAAVEALTPEQRAEGEEVAAGRELLVAELGDRRPRLPSLEQRAAQVGLSILYDVLYRYESGAGPHPTMMSVDLLLEKHPNGLVLRGEPTAQFAVPPVYLHGAYLLYEALKGSAELTPALDLPELPSLGSDLNALLVERMNTQVPNWRELLPPEIIDQVQLLAALTTQLGRGESFKLRRVLNFSHGQRFNRAHPIAIFH